MRREHTKNRSWLGWGLLVALAALVVLIMPLGRGGDVAFADPVPAACDANEGTATALISAEATRGGVPVESGEVNPGDIITYTVGAALGETAGIACSVFAIQVHLNTPDGNWLDPAICIHPTGSGWTQSARLRIWLRERPRTARNSLNTRSPATSRIGRTSGPS